MGGISLIFMPGGVTPQGWVTTYLWSSPAITWKTHTLLLTQEAYCPHPTLQRSCLMSSELNGTHSKQVSIKQDCKLMRPVPVTVRSLSALSTMPGTL